MNNNYLEVCILEIQHMNMTQNQISNKAKIKLCVINISRIFQSLSVWEQDFTRTNKFMMKLREYSGNEYYSGNELLSPPSTFQNTEHWDTLSNNFIILFMSEKNGLLL